MNIYAKKGDKVRFLNDHGRDSEREFAATLLKEGEVYTVDHTDVYGWHTDVYLEEIPSHSFNSVMFEDADKPGSVAEEIRKFAKEFNEDMKNHKIELKI